MTTTKDINTNDVTQEQIDRCSKVVDLATGKAFYQVTSESDPTVEYAVRYSKQHGFTCTCKSGQNAFSNTKSGYCKHVKWSVAAANQEKKAARIARLEDMGLTNEEATQAASAYVEIDGHFATDEELVRIYGPRQPRPTNAEMERDYRRYCTARDFQVMK